MHKKKSLKNQAGTNHVTFFHKQTWNGAGTPTEGRRSKLFDRTAWNINESFQLKSAEQSERERMCLYEDVRSSFSLSGRGFGHKSQQHCSYLFIYKWIYIYIYIYIYNDWTLSLKWVICMAILQDQYQCHKVDVGNKHECCVLRGVPLLPPTLWIQYLNANVTDTFCIFRAAGNKPGNWND